MILIVALLGCLCLWVRKEVAIFFHIGKLPLQLLETTHPNIIHHILKNSECFYWPWHEIVFVRMDTPDMSKIDYLGRSHYIRFKIRMMTDEPFDMKNLDKYRKFAEYYSSGQFFLDGWENTNL